MGNLGKTLSSMFVLVFLLSLVILPPVTVKAQSKTIVVPDDYPTIQAAIGNASAGDIVFVKSGTYDVFWLEINKPLQLIGQDPEGVIINGDAWLLSPGGRANLVAITVSSSDVLISGFTFTNCQNAIVVRGSESLSGITITGNKFVENHFGVSLDRKTTDFRVAENYFSKNGVAISFSSAKDAIISQNIVSCNGGAISLSECDNVTIQNNEVSNNSFGIVLGRVSYISVIKNNITENKRDYQSTGEGGFGIEFKLSCNNCSVFENNIEQNIFGIYLVNSALGVLLSFGSGNIVYSNNLVDNSKNVNVEQGLSYKVENTAINGTTVVSWDNGTVGNYWSDYNGNGSYAIDKNNVDHYPLTQQIVVNTTSPTPSVPEFSWLVILPLFVFTIVGAVAVRYRFNNKKRHQVD
jgi:nitrous oxidase accessory protein